MRTQSPDTDPAAERFQIVGLRRMTPGRRLRLAADLTRMARRLSWYGLRQRYPAATDEELRYLWCTLHYGTDLAAGYLAAWRARSDHDAWQAHVGDQDGEEQMESRRNTLAVEVIALILPIVRALDQLSIPYVIGGSIASSVWGMFRTTNDADIVIDLQPEEVAPLVALLANEYYVDEETVQDAVRRRSSFNAIHLDTMLKADVFVRKLTPFAAIQFANAHTVPLDEPAKGTVMIAAPEDTVLNKLVWYQMGGGVSERQWLDVLGVLKVQGPALDQGYMREWAAQLGVTPLLEQALAEGHDEQEDEPPVAGA